MELTKRWLRSDLDLLVAEFSASSYAQMARVTGRTVEAVKHQTKRLGLLRKRRWTAQEIGYVRRNAREMSALQMGECLGRTEQAVFDLCRRHQISIKKCGDNNRTTKVPDSDVRLIRALADEGVSNAEIARKFEIDPSHCLQLTRRRLLAEDAVLLGLQLVEENQ